MPLVNISPGTVASYHGTAVPTKARLYANRSFFSSDGTFIEQGSVTHRPDFYQEFNCSLVGTGIVIAAGQAHSTVDSLDPTVSYTLAIYDADGAWIVTPFTKLRITNTAPLTWEEIFIYSQARALTYPLSYLDATETLNLINAAIAAAGGGGGGGGGGTVNWGSILGALSNQSDLKSALNAKQNLLALTTAGSSGPATLVGSALNIPQYTGGGSSTSLANTYGNSLATAIAAIGSTPTTLVVDANTTVSTPLTVPATLILKQVNKAVITIAAGGQLTFLGQGIDNPMTLTPFIASTFNSDLPSVETQQWSQAQVNVATDTIDYGFAHGFFTGEQVKYIPHPTHIGEIGGLNYSHVYYIIAVSSTAIKLAATYADAVAGTPVPINLTSSGGVFGTFGAVQRSPFAWTGTVAPPMVSTELFDTGNNSLTSRITVLDGALGFHHGTIYCVAGRIITSFVNTGDYHSLRFGPGDHQNTFNVGTQFFMPFYMGSHSVFTSDPGAIIYESSVFGRNSIVCTRDGATDVHIIGNHFKGNGAAFNSSDGGIAIVNASNCSIRDNWTDGLNSYHIGIVQNNYTLDSDKTFTNASVNTTANTITVVGHGYRTGVPHKYTTAGTLPAPLVAGTTYYIIKVDADTVKVATSLVNAKAGTAIDLTTTGDSATKTIDVDGITGQANYLCENNIIDGNLITGYITQLLFIIGAQHATITHNHILLDYLDIGFGINGALVDFEPNTQFETITDVDFSFNYISTRNQPNTSYTRGIEVQSGYTEGCARIKIHDNTFVFYVAGDAPPTLNLGGVQIDHGASDIEIYNNTFVGSGYSDISVTLSRNVKVHDNYALVSGPHANFNTVYDAVVIDNQFGSLTEMPDIVQWFSSDGTGKLTMIYPISSINGGGWQWMVGLPVFFNETVYTILTVEGNETDVFNRRFTTNPSFPANVPNSAVPSTSVNTATDEITTPTNHLLLSGDRVIVLPQSGAVAPTGVVSGQEVFVIKTAANKYKLALTHADALAGAAIDLTAQGSGTVNYTPGWTLQFGSVDFSNNRVALDDQTALDSNTKSQLLSTAYDKKVTSVKDVPYTVHQNEGIIVYTSLTTGRTVTLPSAVGIRGKEYIIKDGTGTAGANNITIDGAGAETIDGALTKVISTNWGSVRIKSNGIGWITI
jgi:hypothetical protein